MAQSRSLHHSGVDGGRVAIYGQWISEDSWRTALSDDAVTRFLRQADELGVSDRGVYRVDFIADSPTP